MNFRYKSKFKISLTVAVLAVAFFALGSVVVKAAPPAVTITASPGTVPSGSASTLTWSSTDATTCTASGDWSGTKATSGTESTGALTSGKTYTIACDGPEGTATAFTFVSISATPTPPPTPPVPPPTPPVPPPPAATPTVTITASPGTVPSGSASTLTWSSTDATTCTASGDWSGTKATSGTESTGALTAGKTYTIACTGAGGTATAFTFVSISATPTPPPTPPVPPPTPPVPPPPAATPTVTITASPGTVPSGSASTLTWSSTDATTCTASGDWSGTKATSGTESTGALTAGKTYTIACTGAGGTATAFTFVSISATPTPPPTPPVPPPTPPVPPPPAATPTVTITASPGTVPSGSASTLTWSSTDATTCTASGDWSGTKATSGTESTGALTAGKTYTIACTGAGGTATAFTFVTVTAAPPAATPTVTITASPGTVPSGSASTLTWSSTDATTCTASGDWSGTKATSGTESTGALTAGKTYTIACTGAGGTATAFTFVTVTAAPPAATPTVTITASPGTVPSGSASTLTWSSTDATTCTASGDWSGTKATSGTESTGALTAGKTYTIACTGAGGTATAFTFVTVTAAPPTPTGTITFCLILADQNNNVATSSAGLPAGIFSINLNNIASTTVQAKTWSTATFSPNTRIILGSTNDSDCITFSNLPLGNYSYSQLAVTGAQWRVAKYNDNQQIQPINNVFDFANFASSTISDGQIAITSSNPNQRLVIYEADDVGGSCPAPQITSSLTASAVQGQAFTYTITATSTTPVTFAVSGTLPTGLTFNSSTNTISGVPTQSGTFNITLNAVNTCVGGIATKILVLNIVAPGTPSANLGVSKTSNRTTANVGDTVIYTITATNSGPDNATGVIVTDNIPAGISFGTSTVSVGSFNSSTGIWTIGNLNNGASATMTITGTVRTGFQGQNIPNTAVISGSQADTNSSNNTSTVTVSVINPGCTSNCGGGGGGGGPLPTVDLAVSKTSNKTTANVGDTVIYTITIVNGGPYEATALYGVDNLPSGISFVQATSSQGYYNPGNGMWTVGSLSNGATATLTIRGIVRTGYQGQAITNSVNVYAAQTDLNPGNNTASVTINATGVAPTTCFYLLDYLRKDFNNNPVEVKKLQVFLRDLEGFTSVQITGIYDDQTIVALNAFQARYASEILTPWGHTAPTSYTYILTKKKVNEIYCKMAFPVTPLQQAEIDNYRNFLAGLQNSGIQFPSTGIPPTTIVVPSGTSTPDVLYGEVGVSTTTTNTLGTVSGTSTLSRLTANIASAGDWLSGWFDSACEWLNWLLLLIIAIVSYLWYREREENKKLDNINKDLLIK